MTGAEPGAAVQRTVRMMAAPVGPQPGEYVSRAYAGRDVPTTERVDLAVEWRREGARLRLAWRLRDRSVRRLTGPESFVDAAALMVPRTPSSPWLTMGTPGAEVEGILWRADRSKPWRMTARGLGTVVRSGAPPGWRVAARQGPGGWHLQLDLAWPLLVRMRRVGIAVWQGASAERAGLKSVSPGWIDLEP